MVIRPAAVTISENLILNTLYLKYDFMNVYEICVRVVPHALVPAKTFWGIRIALRAFEQRLLADILENRRLREPTGAG